MLNPRYALHPRPQAVECDFCKANDIVYFVINAFCRCLQHCAYSYMEENKAGWMLLDPTENNRDAQRILTVWRAVPEARRPALMTAVYCSFKRAAKVAEEHSENWHPIQTKDCEVLTDSNNPLWKSMARVPSAIIRSIIEQEYFHND